MIKEHAEFRLEREVKNWDVQPDLEVACLIAIKELTRLRAELSILKSADGLRAHILSTMSQESIDHLLGEWAQRLRAENEALRHTKAELLKALKAYETQVQSYDWISLPCAPERLPKEGYLVVIQTRNQYVVGPWLKLFDLGSQILRFKIIEMASK